MLKSILDTKVTYSYNDLMERFRFIAMVHGDWAEERCRAAVARLCTLDQWGVPRATLTPREVVAYAHDLAKEIGHWY